MLLTDSFSRQFSYLRLSITDKCNFQCQYCLPNGYQKSTSCSYLSKDEITRLIKAFAELGVAKIRLTGGEPTLRRDFVDILSVISHQPGIQNIALTTNGYRLHTDAHLWFQAGLTGINVSLDSLRPDVFYHITGQDKLLTLLSGIEKALMLGFKRIKVNVVLMKEVNSQDLPLFMAWVKDRPVQLRFIELMETGLGRDYFRQHHVSAKLIEEQLIQQGWQRQSMPKDAGPAHVYSNPDYLGEIGLIMPYVQNFCDGCNRLRVSSTGKLHLCLFGTEGIALRDLLEEDGQQDELKERLVANLRFKREKHFLHQNDTGITQNLAFIGG